MIVSGLSLQALSFIMILFLCEYALARDISDLQVPSVITSPFQQLTVNYLDTNTTTNPTTSPSFQPTQKKSNKDEGLSDGEVALIIVCVLIGVSAMAYLLMYKYFNSETHYRQLRWQFSPSAHGQQVNQRDPLLYAPQSDAYFSSSAHEAYFPSIQSRSARSSFSGIQPTIVQTSYHPYHDAFTPDDDLRL
eukprot:gene4237-4539_t